MPDSSPSTAQPSQSHFNGQLSLAEIAAGIAAVLQNARTLVADAQLLLEHGRYARAKAVAISALEECGKASVLGHMSTITPSTQSLWRRRWREFRSHQMKGRYGYVQLIDDEGRTDVLSLLDEVPGVVHASEGVEGDRQAGVYVDFDAGTRRWETPITTTAEEAGGYVEEAVTAVARQSALETLGLYGEKVLALRARVYGPLLERWGGGDPERIAALDMRKFVGTVTEAHSVFKSGLDELGIRLPGQR